MNIIVRGYQFKKIQLIIVTMGSIISVDAMRRQLANGLSLSRGKIAHGINASSLTEATALSLIPSRIT